MITAHFRLKVMIDPAISLVTPPSPGKFRTALIYFAVTFLAVVGAAAIYAFHQPRVYYSQVMFQIFEGKQGATPLSEQVQAIRSREVLDPVIDNLKLTQSWGFQRNGKIPSKDEVYPRLLDTLEITPIPASNIIHIGVYAVESYEAANIANMLLVVHLKQQSDHYLRVRDEPKSKIRAELAAQRQATNRLATDLQILRSQSGITDSQPESPDSTPASASQDSQAINQYLALKARYIESQKLLETTLVRMESLTQQLMQMPPPYQVLQRAEPCGVSFRRMENVKNQIAWGAVAGLLLGLIAAAVPLCRK